MSKRSLRDERGASAIIIAFSMILLMGIAAVVIDGGFGFSEKRQAQAAVDFGAMAALQAATGASPADAGATEAQAVVAANLPGRSLNWGACTDPDRPAAYSVVSSITPCISFTANFGQSRVRLPDDAVGTTFGRVIGFDEIIVVAGGEAIQRSRATADVLPWTAGSGSLVCLFSNQAPQSVPPCDGPASGFFGYLDIALYGSGELGTPITCSQGTSNTRSAINITRGADHIMAEYNAGDLVLNDHAECANHSENINQLVVQSGSPTQGATEGLITGIAGSINGSPFSAEDGRLEPTTESTAPVSVRGFTLDDTPLWTYLTNPGCPWAGILVTGAVDTFREMLDCLDQWTPGEGPIFSAALDDHKRFGAVPIFTTYPTGPGSYLIDYFSPIWIETIYQNCNSNRCHTIFSPGEPGGGDACPDPLIATPTINCGHGHTSGSDTVEGVTGFQLLIGMLHPDTQEFFPGTASVREINLLR